MRPAPLAGLCLAACAATSGQTPVKVAGAPGATAAATIEIAGDFRQGGFARGVVPGATVSLSLDAIDVPFAADGGFIIAFARDAAASAMLAATIADGRRVVREIAVADHVFPEERLPPIDRRFAQDPAFAERRAGELARIAAARRRAADASGWRQTFIPPATGRISGVFGAQRFFGDMPESPHSGTDIAAAAGTAVVAPAAGIVVLASPPEYSLEGNLVIVNHGFGLYSSFLHLGRVDVAAGDRLGQGTVIGSVGATGRTTGPHLHWGVIWQGVRFDPESLSAALSDARKAL